jgi:STAS-like domain of unknown function (DUF4325)
MVTIQVRDLVDGANTADQGNIVFSHLHAAMAAGVPFVVSFATIQTATSSFVTAAFARLLNDFSFADIKQLMRVTESTRQINQMIRTRLERTALQAAA